MAFLTRVGEVALGVLVVIFIIGFVLGGGSCTYRVWTQSDKIEGVEKKVDALITDRPDLIVPMCRTATESA